MKIRPFFWLILCSSFCLCHNIAVIPAALSVLTAVTEITYVGRSIYELIELKRQADNDGVTHAAAQIDDDVAYASQMMLELSHAVEENRKTSEFLLEKLMSNQGLQHFQQNVGFRAHTTFILAEKYLENQSNFTKEVFLNEFLRNPPYALLSYLDSMLSANWFLTQSRLHNCRFRDVEALRIQILYSIEQSILSHFMCMTVQTHFADSSDLTKMVLSTVTNITQTLERQFNLIEETYFPHYVAREVISATSALSLPESLKERNFKIANITTFLLTESYGHGVFAKPQGRLFLNYDYTVHVGVSDIDGYLPEDRILKIGHRNYVIFIYRSNVSRIIADASHDTFLNTLITNITCKADLIHQLTNICTKHDFCGLTNYDENSVTMGQNNLEQTADRICGEPRLLITGLPLGSSPRETDLERYEDASQKEYVALLQKTRRQVSEKLKKVRKARRRETLEGYEEVTKADALAQFSSSTNLHVVTGIGIAICALIVF